MKVLFSILYNSKHFKLKYNYLKVEKYIKVIENYNNLKLKLKIKNL